ncbi:unnamed protein product [Clonostachys rosea f. rosea IK726]|uniref:Uncharacterized protein n=1 Tax=Clonostachys rosea f. rosea IK726 TaxID=1349383 RepID=A0ACA9ULD9_BIOOC|nr:unnamed protein product [Clonostachys rosea f. rosea IK726]
MLRSFLPPFQKDVASFCENPVAGGSGQRNQPVQRVEDPQPEFVRQLDPFTSSIEICRDVLPLSEPFFLPSVILGFSTDDPVSHLT